MRLSSWGHGSVQLTTRTVGQSNLRVISGGSGSTLLFLHGMERHPGDATFLNRLAEHRHVVAPEHPGYGESTGFDSLKDLVDVVLHYRTLVESLGDEPVDLVGHCVGGMFAAEFAALCPHLVRRLVLVAPYGLWLDDLPLPDPFAMEPDDLKRAKWGANEPPDPEPSIALAFPDDPHAQVFDRVRNMASATKFLWPIPDRGLGRRLPYIKAKTLIVIGDADGLVLPAYANEFARLIPEAKVKTIDGAGHYPMFDREAEFTATVEAFLDAD